MLAIALSALVLYLVSVALDLHLGALDRRRSQVEEVQLARTLLELIANDLRSVIYTPPDEGGSRRGRSRPAANRRAAASSRAARPVTAGRPVRRAVRPRGHRRGPRRNRPGVRPPVRPRKRASRI